MLDPTCLQCTVVDDSINLGLKFLDSSLSSPINVFFFCVAYVVTGQHCLSYFTGNI